ncbi:MAG: class I SAM-dependent RNA methyltransferase [Smithella sp.]
MQAKDRAIIKIESVAFGGAGVGRVDHVVVFVPFSAQDDELEIEITQVKKKFARGRILKIIKPSPARVKPLCRYYEKCGGCCYQHINYPYQLSIKKNQVEEAFWKIGKMTNPPVGDVIASPRIYQYRGKAQLHAETVPGGKIGFLDVNGGTLVHIDRCEIMEETINEKLRLLQADKQRINHQTELNIWSGDSSADADGKSIVRVVKGEKILVPYDGFFQANLYLTDRLVDEVCRLVSADKVNTLIDAYCGSGLFSIFLANFAEKVIGIEINEKSIRHARINAANAGVVNVSFIHGDMEKVFRQKFMSGNQADLIVLDPPRTGCLQTVLKALVDLQPHKIIYISCNPATQARDVQYLNGCGYHLKSLLPLDMFPQTSHIEIIGLIERA